MLREPQENLEKIHATRQRITNASEGQWSNKQYSNWTERTSAHLIIYSTSGALPWTGIGHTIKY